MYSDAANVNEARKALWDKDFRASYVAQGSAAVIVSNKIQERWAVIYQNIIDAYQYVQ